MDKYEEEFRSELIELHNDTFRLGLGLAEEQSWTATDARGNHGESLQGNNFRYIWLSDPTSLGDEASPQKIVHALEPYIAKADGRKHSKSLSGKINLDAIAKLTQLAKRNKFSFPLGQFANIRWHAIRGAALPAVSILVGAKQKKGADAPEGADAVRDAKGNLMAGALLLHLDDSTPVGSFSDEDLAAAKRAAKKRLGGSKFDLHVLIGAELVQRA